MARKKKPDPKGVQSRVQISPETVTQAITAAANATVGDDRISDVNDLSQPYLTLRQRGGSVLAGARLRAEPDNRHRHPGPRLHRLPQHPRGSREGEVHLCSAFRWKGVSDRETTVVDVGSDLDREYQAALKEPRWSAGRVKPPSKDTQDDVRLELERCSQRKDPSCSHAISSASSWISRPHRGLICSQARFDNRAVSSPSC